jgi:sensor histidine kinase YesM
MKQPIVLRAPLTMNWRGWLVLFGIWTLLAIFFTNQLMLDYFYVRRPISWGQALALTIPEWYLWALLIPPIRKLAHVLHFEKRQWWQTLIVHLAASVVFTYLKLTVQNFIIEQYLNPIYRISIFSLPLNFLIYWVIVGTIYALQYYAKYREQELHALQVEAQLAQAQLHTLKAQLHPHFLFNALHTISALMQRDVGAADRMLTRLSELLRWSLDNIGVQQVTLEQELEFIDHYLTIEKTRFNARLAVIQDIDPKTLKALVPNMILQPLVENAVQHGILPRLNGGQIEIRSQQVENRLCIQIMDDGVGLPPDFAEGIGLGNVRERLQHLYGNSHQFKLESRPEGGLCVTLVLPFELAYERV